MKIILTSILFLTSISTFAQDHRAQKMEKLSLDIAKLVRHHYSDLSREDKREIRSYLKDIKLIFSDNGYEVADRRRGDVDGPGYGMQKFFTARCKVTGYSDNEFVGPAKSIEELQDICKLSKNSQYRSKTYLDGITSETYKVTRATYFHARCKVGGYSDKAPVGPAKSIAELHTMCKLSKNSQYRSKTYLSDVHTKEYFIPHGSYVQANCKVGGYSDNGRVGPTTSIEELHQLCKDSKNQAYKAKTYLENITILNF